MKRERRQGLSEMRQDTARTLSVSNAIFNAVRFISALRFFFMGFYAFKMVPIGER